MALLLTGACESRPTLEVTWYLYRAGEEQVTCQQAHLHSPNLLVHTSESYLESGGFVMVGQCEDGRIVTPPDFLEPGTFWVTLSFFSRDRPNEGVVVTRTTGPHDIAPGFQKMAMRLDLPDIPPLPAQRP